jgi:hypothetical protein
MANCPICKKVYFSKICESESCQDDFRHRAATKKYKIPNLKLKSLVKFKPCKGTTEQTAGFGCSFPNKERKFGLGISCKCYTNWLLNSEKGNEYLNRVTLNTTDKFAKSKKTENSIKDRNTRIELMGNDDYRAKILQPNINKIARLIDFGCTCIATDKFGKMSGGHRISVGANRSTALNLHNIHIQSFASNSWKGGDNLKYDIGIKERYGIEYLEFLNSLHQTPKLGLIKSVLIDINDIALRICLQLSKNEIQRTPQERIDLRNKYNIELGIYSEEFMIFNQKQFVDK